MKPEYTTQGCRVCGHSNENRRHVVREMMFGSRERFDYVECTACGCVQISTYPDDLARHYPKDYWNFEGRRMDPPVTWNMFASWRRRRRTRYWLSRCRDPLGRLLALGEAIPQHLTWLRRAEVSALDVRVLDVGCGIGDRLLALQREGLTRLEGVDPFIDQDIEYPGGVRIHRKSVFDVDGAYDLITLHHSLEHMPDQLAVLRKLRSLLTTGGTLLLRIPVVGYAWREYGADWVQLDAPRHFYLHSIKSVEILARGAGLEVVRVDYDSNAFQFWGSEQYRKDIALYDPRSYEVSMEQSLFTRDDIAAFSRRSRDLNARGDGDQACICLRAAPGGQA